MRSEGLTDKQIIRRRYLLPHSKKWKPRVQNEVSKS